MARASSPAEAAPARRVVRHTRIGLFVRSAAGLYNFVLGVVLFALGGAPAYAFVAWSWPLADAWPLWAQALFRSGALFVAYLVFGASLLLSIVIIRNVFRLGAREGTFSMSDPRLIGYFTYSARAPPSAQAPSSCRGPTSGKGP